jgi:hypothetical protein
MSTLTPSTAKGKTQFEANAWRNRDNLYDPMSSGAYNHTNDRLGATEVDEWVSWMYFVNSLILGGAGALRIRNETGGALAAGPVRISSYSYAQDRWLVTLADADANAPAHAILLASLNDTTNGTAYLSGDLTYDTSAASAVGSRCYLAADGTITFTAPTGADQVVQELGEVKVKHATGTIACCVRPPIKVGTSWLQDLAIATAKIAAGAVTYAKIQNISAQGKVLGRSTAAAGVAEEVACDESTITLPAGSTIQAKPAVPRWVSATKTYTNLAAAATTNGIEVYSLPAGYCIHAVKIKHSTAFTGGAISAYTVQVGTSGTTDKYAGAFNVFQAAGDTTFQVSEAFGTENHGSATSILLTATSTGANLDQAAAGSVTVWLLVSGAL